MHCALDCVQVDLLWWVSASTVLDAFIECLLHPAPQEGTLGHPVSVLLGHVSPVTFLSFCEAAPGALLSVSLDSTCRIWDAETGGAAMHVLRPSALFGKEPHPRLVCLRCAQLVHKTCSCAS